MEKESKLIVLRLDAGHERGMGHLFRMKILGEELERIGHRCLFVIRENEVTQQILRRACHRYVAYPDGCSEENIIGEYFGKNTAPDLWIFDVLSTESKWIEQVKRQGPAVICFDDLGAGSAVGDLVINAIAGCWERSALVTDGRARVLSGPKYAIIEPAVLRAKARVPETVEKLRIAVTMGGSDTHGATVRLAKALSQIEVAFEISFFLGPHFEHEKELTEAIRGAPYPWIKRVNVPQLHGEVADAHLAICGGGQTLFELCAMGMFVAALANEVHEEETIAYFARHGACVDIGSMHKDINITRLEEAVTAVETSGQSSTNIRRNAKRLVDGKGLSRCVEECRVFLA